MYIKKHAVFQISFVCHQCGCHFISVPTKWNSSNDFKFRQLRSVFICVHFLAHQLILQAQCFSVTYQKAGSPNTIELFSSTSAECFPTLPSWPISLCMEWAQGVHALAPLLDCFVSHLPSAFSVSAFSVRLVLLIKAGHSSCQQWVNTVVSETLQSFCCCLLCAYPATSGKACLWW